MENSIANVKLNLLKCFACIGVVFIHVNYPGVFGKIVSLASEYAVPVFYMVAGYFAYGKNSDVIKRRLIKIIKIFLYGYTVFFLYNIFTHLRDNGVFQWLVDNYTWKTPLKYIFLCTIDSAIPLWYLIAMIETYFVWFLVIKHGKENIFVMLIPLLFLFQIGLTACCETKQLDWSWKTNFITRALPWFVLGYYLNSDKSQKLRSIKVKWLIVMITVGCLIAVIPSVFDFSIKFNVIGYIPYTFGLFALTLKNPTRSICRPLEFIGDKLSLNIYIYHVLVGIVFYDVLTKYSIVDTWKFRSNGNPIPL